MVSVPPTLCVAELRGRVAENLYRCLELRRVSIVHMADGVAISRSHLQRVLAAHVSVRLDRLVTIAVHLSVDPADLVGELPDVLRRVEPSRTPFRQTLARNTRRCLRDRGLAPLALVETSGLSKTTVHELLAGHTALDIDRLAKLAVGLSISPDVLVRA